MRLKLAVLFFLSTWAVPVFSAAGTTLTRGRYVAELIPPVDARMADIIKEKLMRLDDIGAVDIDPIQSSLRFTIKEGAHVSLLRLSDAIKSVAPGTAISDPVPE